MTPDRRAEYYGYLIADGYTDDEASELAQARSAMADHDQIDTQGESE